MADNESLDSTKMRMAFDYYKQQRTNDGTRPREYVRFVPGFGFNGHFRLDSGK